MWDGEPAQAPTMPAATPPSTTTLTTTSATAHIPTSASSSSSSSSWSLDSLTTFLTSTPVLVTVGSVAGIGTIIYVVYRYAYSALPTPPQSYITYEPPTAQPQPQLTSSSTTVRIGSSPRRISDHSIVIDHANTQRVPRQLAAVDDDMGSPTSTREAVSPTPPTPALQRELNERYKHRQEQHNNNTRDSIYQPHSLHATALSFAPETFAQRFLQKLSDQSHRRRAQR